MSLRRSWRETLHGIDIGLELIAGERARQRRLILWLWARERRLPGLQIGCHHAHARCAGVASLKNLARHLCKAVAGLVDLLDAVPNEGVLALQHGDHHLPRVLMERRGRAGIEM